MFIRVRHVGKVLICSAEEFLELYEIVEAVNKKLSAAMIRAPG